MRRERIRPLTRAGAERARHRGRHCTAEPGVRQVMHGHDERKHQRHPGERVGVETT